MIDEHPDACGRNQRENNAEPVTEPGTVEEEPCQTSREHVQGSVCEIGHATDTIGQGEPDRNKSKVHAVNETVYHQIHKSQLSFHPWGKLDLSHGNGGGKYRYPLIFLPLNHGPHSPLGRIKIGVKDDLIVLIKPHPSIDAHHVRRS